MENPGSSALQEDTNNGANDFVGTSVFRTSKDRISICPFFPTVLVPLLPAVLRCTGERRLF